MITPNLTKEPLRPRDLALLLLASRDLRPRQRARDQQADLAGLALKRQVLERIAALDPEPPALESTLAGIAEELGKPSGPARAMATLFRDEWHMACSAPDWVAQLLAEALEPPNIEPRGNSRG
jgi:hypothetical protein